MNLNIEYLWHSHEEVYHQLTNFPAEIIPLFERVVYQMYENLVRNIKSKQRLLNQDDEEGKFISNVTSILRKRNFPPKNQYGYHSMSNFFLVIFIY